MINTIRLFASSSTIAHAGDDENTKFNHLDSSRSMFSIIELLKWSQGGCRREICPASSHPANSSFLLKLDCRWQHKYLPIVRWNFSINLKLLLDVLGHKFRFSCLSPQAKMINLACSSCCCCGKAKKSEEKALEPWAKRERQKGHLILFVEIRSTAMGEENLLVFGLKVLLGQ